MPTTIEKDIHKLNRVLHQRGWKVQDVNTGGGNWVKQDRDGYHITLNISTYYDDYEQMYGIVKDEEEE